MRKQGTVVRWEAQRGFGFIRSPGITGDVFFHKQDFRSVGLPYQGLAVSFEEIHVGGKGPRAMAVQASSAAMPSAAGRDEFAARRDSMRPAQAQAVQRRSNSRRHNPSPSENASGVGALFVLALIAAWAAVLAWGVSGGRIPAMAWPMALLLNLATFFVYWVDKHAAQNRRWRTAEQTLHLFALLGGWPGAWIAQRLLRHKSSKASFLAAYWFTVTLHCTVLAGWVFQQQLQQLLQNT